MSLPPDIETLLADHDARSRLSRLFWVATLAFAAGVFIGILLKRHEHPVPVVEHRVGVAHP